MTQQRQRVLALLSGETDGSQPALTLPSLSASPGERRRLCWRRRGAVPATNLTVDASLPLKLSQGRAFRTRSSARRVAAGQGPVLE